MSISKEELRKVLPKNGPNIDEVSKYIEKYKDEIITIKYGGNVFIDRQIFDNFIWSHIELPIKTGNKPISKKVGTL